MSNLLLLALIDTCTGDGLVPAILTLKLQRHAQGLNRKRQKFDSKLRIEAEIEAAAFYEKVAYTICILK